MNLLKAAKLIIPVGVFIFLLFVSSFDFAAAIAVSVYFFLSRVNYLPLFIASPVLFIADLLLDNFDINIRYISDLSLDAYILFTTGVVLYLKSRKDLIDDFWKFIQFILIKKTLFSGKNIFKFALSLIISILLLPVFGGYIAVLSGYALYSYIGRQFDGKIALGFGLIFLIFTAGSLVLEKTLLAEELGNYVFLFLVIGTFQEIINLVRQKKENDKELPERQAEQLKEKINPRIVLVITLLLIFSFLLYYSFQLISQNKFSFPFPKLDFQIPSPSTTPTPTVLPSPTLTLTPSPLLKVSTSAATLKTTVLNGTEIVGLAGSTSAKLKKAGFRNIEIGNAKSSSYKNWEITLKNHDEDIAGILKNVLELDTLTAKEATISAKFDVEIIIGENK